MLIWFHHHLAHPLSPRSSLRRSSHHHVHDTLNLSVCPPPMTCLIGTISNTMPPPLVLPPRPCSPFVPTSAVMPPHMLLHHRHLTGTLPGHSYALTVHCPSATQADYPPPSGPPPGPGPLPPHAAPYMHASIFDSKGVMNPDSPLLAKADLVTSHAPST
jgi:hypothetical protein